MMDVDDVIDQLVDRPFAPFLFTRIWNQRETLGQTPSKHLAVGILDPRLPTAEIALGCRSVMPSIRTTASALGRCPSSVAAQNQRRGGTSACSSIHPLFSQLFGGLGDVTSPDLCHDSEYAAS